MRILYVASDQVVPGRTGGSIHVLEVARGLAGRGHEVHAVVHRSPGRPDREEEAVERGRVVWHRIAWAPDHRFFRLRARAAVGGIADEARPQVLIERYYNFGGEGVLAGADRGLPALLEVNSPVIDHPGSWKARLDAALLVRPFRRHRERLVRQAAALVSPLRDRFKVEVEGGEDIEVQGNIVDHEYEIERGGSKVAQVSKRWFRVRDTYGIQVAPDQDDALILAITVCVEQMAAER